MNSSQFLDKIDWQRPWLAPFRATAASIIQSDDWRAAINSAAGSLGLQNHRDLPIRFVAQAELPVGVGYEAFISATGGVPTRDNLHDFFNALVWLNYPHVKRQLNALQAGAIANSNSVSSSAQSVAAPRGKLRDATTIFDENAALLVTSDLNLIDDLRKHRWVDAFVTRRTEFNVACQVRLFGHAAMEKLTAPYKAITAHAWVVLVSADFFVMPYGEQQRYLDSKVALQLAHGLVTTDFTPLPVLGVPGWWEQQDAAFYNDVAVFRPMKTLKMNGAAGNIA